MNERISKLTELTMSGKMYAAPTKTEFDRMDLFLPDDERNAKQISEYILNQTPVLNEYSALTGFFKFDGCVIGDVFTRVGHKNTDKLLEKFIYRNIDGLSTLDWQHGTADYSRVLEVGISGIIQDAEYWMKKHTDPKKISFLTALWKIAKALSLWCVRCSEITDDFRKNVTDKETKTRLTRLSKALLSISKNAPKSFFEAVLTVYVCFSMNPDSLGTLDRYLSKFYFADIKKGLLTKDEAKEYLQELFLMVQAVTEFKSNNFTKGGQSHFAIGGRDALGKDCYNKFSDLILEALTELPTYIPEVTLRWTNDTPSDVFRRVLSYERNDQNKRIAFTNDDKRIEAYTKICGFPYDEAINYTLVGCNEPAMLGGLCASTSHANLAKAIADILNEPDSRVLEAASFDEFYSIFKEKLYSDLDKIYHYDDLFNLERAKDKNYVSCLFSRGCMENGISITQGGVNYAVSTVMFLGNVTTIDSLAIVKQFVFDEKILTMQELSDALKANWQGFEDLRQSVLKKGCFFGNDDETSNYVASKLYEDLYKYVKNKRTALGYPLLIGDHTGYFFHFKRLGEVTGATPDGRYCGDPLTYGMSQTNSKAKNGLTALMNSLIKLDPRGISSATVTNFHLDPSYTENEESFEKTAELLETFFKNGGIQFQLNYVSKDELCDAQKHPDEHRSLRVRVTGYSDFFNNLSEPTQNSIIERYGDRV